MTKNWRRLVTAGMAVLGAALLAGCFISPGKFDSTLNLQQDGRFTYSYNGQIHFFGLSQLSEMSNKAEQASFEPQPCHSETDDSERPCTAQERAEQREAHEQMMSQANASSEEERAMMQALLGGWDPNDPQAAVEFAAALERQAGWNRVQYLGDGLFDVEFAITSMLDHDFIFPVIEKLPIANSFIMITLRDGDRMKVEAPGFSPLSSGNPMMAMMTGMAVRADKKVQNQSDPKIPPLDGTFRIMTNGAILANNTDGGPRDAEGGKILEWQINSRTSAAPSALIEMVR